MTSSLQPPPGPTRSRSGRPAAPPSPSLSPIRWALGTPRDWRIPQFFQKLAAMLSFPTRPRAWTRFRPRMSWIGNLAVLISVLVGWFAFQGAEAQEGSDLTVAFGLWVGAVSILLMAWSFILAVRIKFLERFFGGLDGVYKTHRWAGTLAVITMFLHTSVEPEVNGIRGAARSVADQAEDLAGAGEVMIYLLLAATFLRLLPYRWWRWTHKAFGIPFLFASWHFFTAEKTYANFSAWGWWFGAWMLAGAVTWAWRLFVRDAGVGSVGYAVTEVEHHQRLSVVRLKPTGRRELGHRAGQFAFLKLKTDGMSEPHPFTIASAPTRADGEMEFVIAHLGDWSARLPELDLVGAEVSLEGPYGHFRPRTSNPDQPTLWVAGGVGLTPFLASIDQARANDRPEGGVVPTLLYCTRVAGDDPMVVELRRAEADGLVRLEVFDTSTGRLTPDDLDLLFPGGLRGHHVAVCGPEGLVADMREAALLRGASRVESEDFDMRKGIGPERSREWAHVVASVRQRLSMA